MGPVIIFSIVILAFFVVGMSLTLIIKGHHIKSEISDNENLSSKGLKCAVQDAREEEARLRGVDCSDLFATGCGSGSCDDCSDVGKKNEA